MKTDEKKQDREIDERTRIPFDSAPIDCNMLANPRTETESSSTVKSFFLSTISHEMRTPLNAIIGMAAIGNNSTDIERKNYALKKIENASKYLMGIINNVLDMSKIEADILELAHSPFDIREIINKAVSLNQFNMEEKHIQFFLNVKDDIPSFFIGDDQRLIQILTNLLSNAVKFTAETCFIRLDVSLEGEKDGICELHFEVADNGIGIPPDKMGTVFNAYEHAEGGISGRFSGIGLGLVITKRIIEMMGGRIRIESELGKGSKFIFNIMLLKDQNDSYKKMNIDNKDKISIKDIHDKFKGKNILVVEDIEINHEVLISLLEGSGLNIDTAVNGRDALDMIIASDKYDLIFMDMQMPIMDGLEATRKIRTLHGQHNKKVPIIAMTANVFQEDINQCLEAGMNDHIGKPLDVTQIFGKLYEYLSKR